MEEMNEDIKDGRNAIVADNFSTGTGIEQHELTDFKESDRRKENEIKEEKQADSSKCQPQGKSKVDGLVLDADELSKKGTGHVNLAFDSVNLRNDDDQLPATDTPSHKSQVIVHIGTTNGREAKETTTSAWNGPLIKPDTIVGELDDDVEEDTIASSCKEMEGHQPFRCGMKTTLEYFLCGLVTILTASVIILAFTLFITQKNEKILEVIRHDQLQMIAHHRNMSGSQHTSTDGITIVREDHLWKCSCSCNHTESQQSSILVRGHGEEWKCKFDEVEMVADNIEEHDHFEEHHDVSSENHHDSGNGRMDEVCRCTCKENEEDDAEDGMHIIESMSKRLSTYVTSTKQLTTTNKPEYGDNRSPDGSQQITEDGESERKVCECDCSCTEGVEGKDLEACRCACSCEHSPDEHYAATDETDAEQIHYTTEYVEVGTVTTSSEEREDDVVCEECKCCCPECSHKSVSHHGIGLPVHLCGCQCSCVHKDTCI